MNYSKPLSMAIVCVAALHIAETRRANGTRKYQHDIPKHQVHSTTLMKKK